jgi:uncharacterized protein (UPF0335 family)
MTMANQLKANGEGAASPDHNEKEIPALIRKCAREALEIKDQRKELSSQMADIRQRLRDSGVETKAFEFAVKVREMEREAQENYIDWLRISFESLGIGGQSSLFPEAAELDQPKAA